MAKERPLSMVIPVLIAALVSDTGANDPSTNKKSLIGIFDTINVGTFPTRRAVSLYLKITDAEGYYKVVIKFVRQETGDILATVEGEHLSPDRLRSFDTLIPFPPIEIPNPGRYEFQVWFNNIFLGSTSIDAKLRSN